MDALPRFAALHFLPDSYQLVRRITLESQRLFVLLNVVGLAMLAIAILAYQLFYNFLRELGLAQGANPLAGASSLLLAVLSLLAILIMLSLHELIHGIAFQLFGARPRYGFSLEKGVAFAAADRYYLTRDAYLIVGLAPLVVITLLTGALMTVTSGETNQLVALIGAANIGGSVGDLWFFSICRRYQPDLLVRDFGEGAELYARSYSTL
jgi:membrane protein DedA with SNARE-associated domain